MPLSRNVLLVASWNWYVRAPGTGFQAKDGVRLNDVVAGSSARSRKPCSPVGEERAAEEVVAVAAKTARASRDAMRTERTVIPLIRHTQGRSRPSNGGCEERSGRENAGVIAGPPHELNRSGKTILSRAARHRERGPAEAVERVREADAAAPQRPLVCRRQRGDAGHRGCDEQVEPTERLFATLAVFRPQPFSSCDFGVGDRHAELEFPADALAVVVRVLGV